MQLCPGNNSEDVVKLSSNDHAAGTVFDIQRYSIHDGPGIRTLVFLKGCPLRCKWCSNPEGQTNRPQVRFLESRCVGASVCNAICAKACPDGAIIVSPEGKPSTNRAICQGCGHCALACSWEARRTSGRSVTVEELMAEILKDEAYYRSSGGGVTIGGGEPLEYFEFVRSVLERCRHESIHTAIETCGHGPWRHLRSIAELADLIYFDIKHMDSVVHAHLTGVPNTRILSNAKKLLSSGLTTVVVRVPVIPGSNDSEETIRDIARFVIEAGGTTIELMPYHALGRSKYAQLDREYELSQTPVPDPGHMSNLRALAESFGLTVVGGTGRL